MRDNMFEGRWSPFDPKWYKEAFDKYISTADQLFNTNDIIAQGYDIPDADKSKSIMFRNEAILTNSFDEHQLRESLKDIYLNNSHRLKASNHDNTHFFQWFGKISDMIIDYGSKMAQIKIPTENLMYQKQRDIYKRSQFFRKWIKVEDILNNWNVFQWNLLLFINQRIMSEYEIRIDDMECIIRFPYIDKWLTKDYPVYMYKFDTNAQCRVKISKVLCDNQWQWQIPADYLPPKIATQTNIVVAFNRISDPTIRTDGKKDIEKIKVLGDNLEFLEIKDGIIDLSNISNFNKNYITQEHNQWIWMSIFVPKFFHEYPVVIPNDTVYRPYVPDLQPVVTTNYETINHVKSKGKDLNETRQTYIDTNGKFGQLIDGWMTMIRPIVLSDAYIDPFNDGLDDGADNLEDLKQLTIKAAQAVEHYRFNLHHLQEMLDSFLAIRNGEYVNDDIKKTIDSLKELTKTMMSKFSEYVNQSSSYMYESEIANIRIPANGIIDFEYDGVITQRVYDEQVQPLVDSLLANINIIVSRVSSEYNIDLDYLATNFDDIKKEFHNFLETRNLEFDDMFEASYESTINRLDGPLRPASTSLDDLHKVVYNGSYITPIQSPLYNFWLDLSPIIHIPRAIYDKFFIMKAVASLPNHGIVWKSIDDLLDQLRFQRPIDETDFWTFVYDQNAQVWRPYPLNISHKFPDVYIPTDPNASKELDARIFKTFFFYSDTMNVLEEKNKIKRPTASWDEDAKEYYLDEHRAVYRDIFMEKFYWMAIRSIYPGTLVTKCKWEVLEYIIDNESYERFNDLFLNTIDPYYKLGLATYLKSDNFEFPFDDAVTKLNEAMTQKLNKYNKINNFEIYLNKTWIPSYFDYMTNILDDWDYSNRLIRRPRSTFDIDRLMPIMLDMERDIFRIVDEVNSTLDIMLERLAIENYRLNVDQIKGLKDIMQEMYDNINEALTFTENLDLAIYSNDDINYIISLYEKHLEIVERVQTRFNDIYQDTMAHNIYETKFDRLYKVKQSLDGIDTKIREISIIVKDFDMNKFMLATNDLRGYKTANKFNPNDNSLIGYINKFETAWSIPIKDIRDKLFSDTVKFQDMYDVNKSYTSQEIIEFMEVVENIKNGFKDLKSELSVYWTERNMEEDDVILQKLAYSEYIINTFYATVVDYTDHRDELIKQIKYIITQLGMLTNDMTSDYEKAYAREITENLQHLLDCVSHIAGVEDASTALAYNQKIIDRIGPIENAVENLKEYIENYEINTDIDSYENINWTEYLSIEGNIFTNLIKFTKGPVKFVTELQNYEDLTRSMIGYMDTVNIPFIPDREWPSYSDVYECTNVELVSGGFHHEVDDIVCAPRLGTYTVTGVENNANVATGVETNNWYRTTFRDPTIQSNVYDSITSGNGVGITLKPTEVNHKYIINDSVIDPYITKITSINESIRDYIQNPNPYNNLDYKVMIGMIEQLRVKWNKMMLFYEPYVTSRIKTYTEELIDTIQTIITPSEEFMNSRSNIEIESILDECNSLLTESFEYVKVNKSDNDIFTASFNHHYEDLASKYDALATFYGSGTRWKDSEQLKSILSELRLSLNVFKINILDNLEPLDIIDINGSLNNILTYVQNAFDALSVFEEKAQPVRVICNSIDRILERIPIKRVDSWFKLSQYAIANGGTGYKVGDIVSIGGAIDISESADEGTPNCVLLKVTEYVPATLEEKLISSDPDVYRDTEESIKDISEVDGIIYDPEDEGLIVNTHQVHYRRAFKKVTRSIRVLLREIDNSTIHDIILMRVKEVDDNGTVISVEPFMDYAIPYRITKVRKTDNVACKNGQGLIIDFYSRQIGLKDSTYFTNGFKKETPRFDENDMFVFKFNNIYDLDINYEVFLGGKQLTNFVQRHVDTKDKFGPEKLDELYLFANEVYDLRNSSVFIEGEQYFIYHIKDITILDPGAGYAVGQEIIVNTKEVALRLAISKLAHTPYKEIAEVHVSNGIVDFKGFDPETEDSEAVDDPLNNIDDEYNVGYYDKLSQDGIEKAATIGYPESDYSFISKRYDDLENGNRNNTFMYPTVNPTPNTPDNGDPDFHFYAGTRIDNSQIPMENERRYEGIRSIIPHTDPFIPDEQRTPPNQPIKSEFQSFARVRIHNSTEEVNRNVTKRFYGSILNAAMIPGDLSVPSFTDLPKNTDDYPDGHVGSKIIVECDETNYGHRMLYNIRTFIADGSFIYDIPEIADYKWTSVTVDWMGMDYYPDMPGDKAQYPDAGWRSAKTFKDIEHEIIDGKVVGKKLKPKYPIDKINNTSFIKDFSIDDISVYNWTLHKWEDLHDENRWKLTAIEDDKNHVWGFNLQFISKGVALGEGEEISPYDLSILSANEPTLISNTDDITYQDPEIINSDTQYLIGKQEETLLELPYRNRFSYDMEFFWNKTPSAQQRNAALKKNAHFSITSEIIGEVDTESINISVNTGRHLRIRKLFPYEQKENYKIGLVNGKYNYNMDFKLANYIHHKNELLLEDVKLYNHTIERFEDIFDTDRYEILFKDPKAVGTGYETQSRIANTAIGVTGYNFMNGTVWGYNKEYNCHIFGEVTTDYDVDGHILTFKPTHCVNMPSETIALEFDVYQSDIQTQHDKASVVVWFETEQVQVVGDGYIHNVTNRYAKLPDEFRIIPKYILDEAHDMELMIIKSPRKWTFIEDHWAMAPTFTIENTNINPDSVYILVDKGRFPIINPSTHRPSWHVTETESGTNVRFLNLYRRYEHLEIRSAPYPMKSVYVQRHIPAHGFIDTKGKINKPLNKKYFEFWVNGKLMDSEVTIISPTKFFLHGLKSLKNLEIIEIGRDPNEYFADNYITVEDIKNRRPYVKWDYQTYLDDALEGTLEGNNYTKNEQKYLLSPVWPQVERDDILYKDYPENVDIEDDVLTRVDIDDFPSTDELSNLTYQFLILNAPTLEGVPLVSQHMTFDQFGFTPISNDDIADMLNEIWADEIENNPYFPIHSNISDDIWYGVTTRMYDEYGILVHNLNDAAYKITDQNLLKIDTGTKISRIIKKFN